MVDFYSKVKYLIYWLKVEDLKMLNQKLKMFMVQYNETVRGGSMDMVFFKDAMVHLIKVNRNMHVDVPASQGIRYK